MIDDDHAIQEVEMARKVSVPTPLGARPRKSPPTGEQHRRRWPSSGATARGRSTGKLGSRVYYDWADVTASGSRRTP